MSELLPCPFCGGEAEVRTRKNRGSMEGQTLYRIRCSNCHIGQLKWSACLEGHEWGAIEAWNTRAERTCRIEEHDEVPYPICSACGAVQPDDYTVYYCWSCGAKVVGE